MKLLVKREKASDVDYIDSDAILKDYLEEIKILKEKLLIMDEKLSNFKQFDKKQIYNTFVENRIFDIANPIDISGLPDIENFVTKQGIIYYDTLNKRFRGRTDKNWITLNQ